MVLVRVRVVQNCHVHGWSTP